MITTPTECANKPNLWRVACELSKIKNPYMAADLLLALVAKEAPATTPRNSLHN